MDPLTAMKQWYDAGITNMREELALLVLKFHVDGTVLDNSLPAQERIAAFETYMDGTILTKAEVVQRALFLKGLINFGLNGRDTEAGWERAKKSNEQFAGTETDAGYEEFMKDYSIRKANWIAWCHVWRSLEQDIISDDHIGYWYYVEDAVKAEV